MKGVNPLEKRDGEWKIEFMNLPCNEQLQFVQQVAFDEQLQKEFKKWLKNKKL